MALEIFATDKTQIVFITRIGVICGKISTISTIEVPKMRRVLFTSLLLAVFCCSAFAQKEKSWTEWSEKEAAKILNDSPWGQTQTEGKVEAPSSSSAITAVSASRRDSE